MSDATQGKEREFYILSLKHTHEPHRLVTWWKAEDKGYAWDLRHAGRYSEERVRAKLHYYNSGCGTVAVPCDVVDALAEPVTVHDGPTVAEYYGVQRHVYRLRRLFRAACLPFDRPQHASAAWAPFVALAPAGDAQPPAPAPLPHDQDQCRPAAPAAGPR